MGRGAGGALVAALALLGGGGGGIAGLGGGAGGDCILLIEALEMRTIENQVMPSQRNTAGEARLVM